MNRTPRRRTLRPATLAATAAAALLASLMSAPPALAATPLTVSAITASGDDGNVPANTVDNNLSTRWSDEGDGVWIRYDLGSSQTVGWIALGWHRGNERPFTFDVQTSTDGSSWSTAIGGRTSSGTTTAQEEYDFSDRTARYVRVVGHGNTVNEWTSITETDIYGAGSPGGGGGGNCAYPAQVLNLTNWKETLPTGSSESPTEIKQPALNTFAVDPWFKVNASCDGVQFRSAVNGVTTSGSGYPRSELREMTNNGTSNAAWSSTSGTHTLVISQAVTNLPATKPHVVAGQIHDSEDDVTVFRLEGSSLYLTNGDDTHYKLITSSYQLGTRFEAKFVVSGGQVKAYYNGTLQATLSKSFSGAYFKAGAYTQANCTNSSPCSSSNYGQVVIYSVTVSHS
ncbi:polysaccharide lyase family 7 protein [Catellatospora paridis]|uniref:polysaccharide lyase family 7 protein n=1 Tax=Catellatospora paridis TaxID=1617086 RepID=UPI001E3F2977|nr:polysaccharide lyase family 7 protein [Catellatospora paridis]